MRTKLLSALALAVGCVAAPASILYSPPPGGWTYEYNGDVLNTTNGTTVSWSGDTLPVSLDGTWIFGGGSDTFDGSTNGGIFTTNTSFGGNNPGGWTMYTGTMPSDNGVTFIRMQDTGDPRTVGFKDPSNRKLEMARSMTLLDGASIQQLQDGFTFCFRARIPTPSKASGNLDPLYPAAVALGGPGPIPYPAGGDGYVTYNGGKGNIFIHDQSAAPYGNASYGASIAFSLTQTNDNDGADTTLAGFGGLSMNELNGTTANDAVNFGQGSSTNRVTLDPTDWHEFWIVIKADPSGIGTHQVYIYVDGAVTPSTFHLTAGTSEGSVDPGNTGFRGGTFIAIASPSTGQSCAFDLDFIDYKLGEFYPAGAANPPTIVGVAPASRTPFYSGNLSVEVTAAGTATIPDNGAKLVLNGVDVSAGLTPSGTSTDKTFTYSSLQANTVYNGQMIISDSNARAVTNVFFFDTFVDGLVTTIESEEFNYNSGQSINNPAPGAYSTFGATYKVDFLDDSLYTVGTYRPTAVDDEVTVDIPRPRYISSSQTDYDITLIKSGEWCNYTRTMAAGSYSAVLRAASSVAQDVRLDLVTSSPTVPNQTVKYLGTFHVPKTGSAAFADVTLSDVLGNALPLALSGATTLRLTAVSANNDMALNYLVLNPTTAPATPVVSATPAPKATGVLPNASVEAAIYDGGTPVDPASVGLTVNGSAVSPSVVKSGSITFVKYTPPALWSVLSSNNVTLIFTNGTGHSVNWGFTVAYLPTLTPALRVSDAATPGFKFRVFQNNNEDAASTARAEEQLAGLSTYTNWANSGQMGPADGLGIPGADPDHDPLTYHIPTVIDMSDQTAQYGNFVNPGSQTDDTMPGIPGIGAEGGKDGIAAEITTFISLPAGVNTMVVNSDDGFKVQAGAITSYPVVLADVEGLFGAADVAFSFIVQQAGVYPFRMVWYQSDHQFAVEWAMYNSDGTLALVNDTANTQQTGVASFSTGTVPVITRPTITITRAGAGQVTITWGAQGTLTTAPSPAGPYTDVPGAVSPYTTTPGGRTFYRVRTYP